MHRLLQRQIKRYLKTSGAIDKNLQDFIKAIDNAYKESDADRLMLERAFDLSSQELMELNRGVKNALSRFEFLIENTPFIAIQGFDRNGLIIHWNHASSRIYGYAAKDAKGRHIQDIILTSEKAADFNNALDRILTTRMPSDPFEWEVRNRKGERRFVFSSMIPFQEGGDVTEVFFMGLDITDRKRLEAQLLQAQKMEAIGTLAGGIAHDFNNLLMGILGYTQLMIMELDPEHPHYDRLKRIEMQVKSGADLSNQLLGFARGGKYEAKPLDVNEIVEKAATTFARTKKEVVLSLDLNRDVSAVEADKVQIEQVLLNLFVNAWQAMPGGGCLYISTENISLQESFTDFYNLPPGKYVKLTIADTGVGMDKKTMDRIFEPFFTTREMGRGTGLGLATVYGIVNAHRGIITVRSEPGSGTTFDIYLPFCSKPPVAEIPGQAKIQKGRGNILIVDDEIQIIDVTDEMLKTMGYKVMKAGDGSKAVELYEAVWKDIDLIILDMIMPGLSGEATFNELRRINPQAKVLLASGYSLSESTKNILDRGALAFIQKPYDIRELSGKISHILNGLPITSA